METLLLRDLFGDQSEYVPGEGRERWKAGLMDYMGDKFSSSNSSSSSNNSNGNSVSDELPDTSL